MMEENNSNMSKDESEERDQREKLIYSVIEIPPWYITFVYAIQQILASIGGPLSMVYVIHGAVCTQGQDGAGLLFAEMLNATLFMMGVAGLLQTTFGIRLPIVQGSSGAFIAPIIAMTNTKQFACPTAILDGTGNFTSGESNSKLWEPRLATIAGSLMAASVLQIVLGLSGFMGLMMKYIGPLTIIPTVALIGLSLFEVATRAAQHQWGIAMLTVGLIVIFAVLLNDVKVPLPTWSKKNGCSYDKYRIFRLFPHITAITVCWILSHILTVTDVFPPSTKNETNFARTDAKPDVISQAEWFLFPYPGRISGFDFNAGVFAGMCAAVLASIIESVGDYYATAYTCQLPPPSKHAVNRGILMEGIASLLSGSLGMGHATTSYSSVSGFIAVTGMGSRCVWQAMGGILIVMGLVGKFGAALSIMPDPIIGGLTIVGLGMVISVGLANIRHVDMQSSRNLLILGISFILAMMLPTYLNDNPDAINTGNADLDTVFTVLLSTGMLIGGVVGFTLDNILPGTKKERGMITFQQSGESTDIGDVRRDDRKAYDLPFITPCLSRIKCLSYVPVLPSFRDELYDCSPCKSYCKKKPLDETDSDTKM